MPFDLWVETGFEVIGNQTDPRKALTEICARMRGISIKWLHIAGKCVIMNNCIGLQC